METTHRIKIKLGDAEFEAEGPSDLINAQFSAFLEAVSKATPKAAPTPVAPSSNTSDDGANANDAASATAVTTPAAPNVSSDTLSRVFKVNDTVSLLAIPKTDKPAADALLVILYGYDRMKSISAVTGTTLMKGAKQSGINIDRIDRIMGTRDEFVNFAGAKKGRRYSLNNRGVAEAEKIIRKMME